VEAPEFSRVTPLFPVGKNFKRRFKVNSYSEVTIAKIVTISVTVVPKFSEVPSILMLTLILRRSRTGTVWFYTSTSNKRAAQPKLYTKSLTRDLKCMYSRLTLVRISINL